MALLLVRVREWLLPLLLLLPLLRLLLLLLPRLLPRCNCCCCYCCCVNYCLHGRCCCTAALAVLIEQLRKLRPIKVVVG